MPLELSDLSDDLVLHIIELGWEDTIVGVRKEYAYRSERSVGFTHDVVGAWDVCRRWRKAIRLLVQSAFSATHARADGFTIYRPTPYERCCADKPESYFPLLPYLKEKRTIRTVETVDVVGLMEHGGKHVSATMSLPHRDGDDGQCHWWVVFECLMLAPALGLVAHRVISATAYGTHGALVQGGRLQFTVGVLNEFGLRHHFALDTALANSPSPRLTSRDDWHRPYQVALHNRSVFREWGANFGQYTNGLPAPMWKDWSVDEVRALPAVVDGKVRIELYICDFAQQ